MSSGRLSTTCPTARPRRATRARACKCLGGQQLTPRPFNTARAMDLPRLMDDGNSASQAIHTAGSEMQLDHVARTASTRPNDKAPIGLTQDEVAEVDASCRLTWECLTIYSCVDKTDSSASPSLSSTETTIIFLQRDTSMTPTSATPPSATATSATPATRPTKSKAKKSAAARDARLAGEHAAAQCLLVTGCQILAGLGERQRL